jgi:DNA-directed RNA polymerase specialized sigma24 family protein
MVSVTTQDSSGDGFLTTPWTTIQKARDADPGIASAALGRLATRYQGALRAFLLQIGCPRQEVDDVLHDFVADRFLSGHLVQNVESDRGEFRRFLRTCLRRFLISHYRSRARRAWIQELESIDEVAWASGESCVARQFDRLWAEQVIANARSRIRAEAAAGNRSDWCAAMEELIDEEPTPGTLRRIANRLGMTSGAVSTASHRFRERLRWLIRDEVRLTVREPGDWKEEFDHLLAALRS